MLIPFQNVKFQANRVPQHERPHSTKPKRRVPTFDKLNAHLLSLIAYKNLWQIDLKLVDLSLNYLINLKYVLNKITKSICFSEFLSSGWTVALKSESARNFATIIPYKRSIFVRDLACEPSKLGQPPNSNNTWSNTFRHVFVIAAKKINLILKKSASAYDPPLMSIFIVNKINYANSIRRVIDVF